MSKPSTSLDLSIVLPVLNEAASLAQLYGELSAALATLELDAEIIFVNDGSSDDSQNELLRLAALDSRLRVLQFSRPRGKSIAYSAGFAASRGPIIVTMDSDLQDDPHEIGALLDALERGADLVVGWKQGRVLNEPTKAIPSRVFNRTVGALFGLRLRDINSGFRAMRAEVARSLDLYGDFYRFIPLIAHSAGFRVAQTPVVHRPRQHGHSKYGGLRFWTSILDLMTLRFILSFRERPFHIFGTIAWAFLFTGLGLETYALIQKLTGDSFQSHMPAIVIGALTITVGTQMLLTGLLSTLLARPLDSEVGRTAIDITPRQASDDPPE